MAGSIGVWDVAAGALFGIIAASFFLPTSKERASAECDARAIEHRLDGLELSRHKTICMAANGFKRNTTCNVEQTNQRAASCYSFNWEFWVKEAELIRSN